MCLWGNLNLNLTNATLSLFSFLSCFSVHDIEYTLCSCCFLSQFLQSTSTTSTTHHVFLCLTKSHNDSYHSISITVSVSLLAFLLTCLLVCFSLFLTNGAGPVYLWKHVLSSWSVDYNGRSLALLQDSGVGKSSIVMRFVTGTYRAALESTIG